MRWKKAFALLFSMTAFVGCNAAAEPQSEEFASSQQAWCQPLPPPEIRGYKHDVSRTRFRYGSFIGEGADVGYQKTVGTDGVFATRISNGSAEGVSNATSPALAALPWAGTGAEHNQIVRDYFVGVGIPVEQIAFVHANSQFRAIGTLDGKVPETRTLWSYQSVLTRVVAGVVVVDSTAWATLNNDGEVVAEHVHWPAFPATVLDDALALKLIESDPVLLARYRRDLPPGVGRVAIRHTSFVGDEAFWAFATYDIEVEVAVVPGGTTSYTRHFLLNGSEVRLPDELRPVSPSTTKAGK